jgi:hypothetical protein
VIDYKSDFPLVKDGRPAHIVKGANSQRRGPVLTHDVVNLSHQDVPGMSLLPAVGGQDFFNDGLTQH